MENYTTQRPSLLPAACAPSTLSTAAAAPVATPVLAPAWAPIPQVHQVQIQAELAQVRVLTSGYGINGFQGRSGSVKQMDGARGVPPRGRPV